MAKLLYKLVVGNMADVSHVKKRYALRRDLIQSVRALIFACRLFSN